MLILILEGGRQMPGLPSHLNLASFHDRAPSREILIFGIREREIGIPEIIS
jgi:hypothetical protein